MFNDCSTCSRVGYFYYYLSTSVREGRPGRAAQSHTVDSLRRLDAHGLARCLPTVSEQRQIVEFLDRETAKIDALIGKQEQLIATLREDRTATITHAVTKGLDPAVKMRDSGIPWLDRCLHTGPSASG